MGWRELVLWACVLLLANNVVAALIAPHDPALGWTWLEQTRFGGFDALAWGVALWRLAKTPTRPATIGELALVISLCLLGSLKQKEAAPFALTGLAFWLFTDRRIEARAVAAVLLAIAVHQFWSRVVFSIVSPELVRTDAMMVGAVMTLAVKGVGWQDNLITMPNGFRIVVLESCSSFANVSASLLAWVALAKLERLHWVRNDIWVALAAVLAQVALNIIRLCLLAQSQAMYLYWHDGAGAQIYVAAASGTAVLIGVLGTRWAAGVE
jgi:exosortase/archaeosortase family protein